MRHLLLALLLTGAATGAATAQDGPRLDVVFLLDATGSMGDEIDVVKDKIRDMISEIALGEPAPDVRFGLVAYRDRGDEYVTRSYPLTRDIDRVVADLATVEANGGGDYPESLTEGLHVAVQEMAWEAGASRLVFLIADAPPHLDYPDDYDWRDEVAAAEIAGIAVHAIGASGLDETGEAIYRQIAGGTGGQFQWLVYESRYTDADGDEVVVRVEGRSATYTKADSSWTVEGGGVPLAGGMPGAVRGGDVLYAEAADGEVRTTDAADGGAAEVATTTNLDALITGAIKDAAEKTGVDYSGDPTAVEATSWGTLKATAAER